MGAFFKIFIVMLCMNVLLSICFPVESQAFSDNFFTQLLNKQVDPITGETSYTGFNESNTNAAWSEGGNQDSSFLSKLIDGLSVVKTLIATIVNLAILPITITIKVNMPFAVKMMVFIPLAILYLISAAMTLIRGVNP